jgi:hypothetical protein
MQDDSHSDFPLRSSAFRNSVFPLCNSVTSVVKPAIDAASAPLRMFEIISPQRSQRGIENETWGSFERRESNVQSSPRCASSVTSVVKPAIHLASVWYSVDRPLGECPEIVESLERITFQRAWAMSRIPSNDLAPAECVRVRGGRQKQLWKSNTISGRRSAFNVKAFLCCVTKSRGQPTWSSVQVNFGILDDHLCRREMLACGELLPARDLHSLSCSW